MGKYGELPDPKQLIWAHSTCSKKELNAALLDPSITAIETDIVMGRLENQAQDDSSSTLQPIMAHPPNTTSDLNFLKFIEAFTADSEDFQHKHLKLDFKDLETIDPVLNSLNETLSNKNVSFDKTIFLNADILPGPGRRCGPLAIGADAFIDKCLAFVKIGENKKKFAFSLGWRVDPRSLGGYTVKDVQEMKDIIDKHNLLHQNAGIVLAVNARTLAKDPTPFDPFLKEYPEISLLIWTATGDPPISRSKITYIEEHFKSIGCANNQVGFDCLIASSVASGMWYDNIVKVVGLIWNAKHISSMIFDNILKLAGSLTGSSITSSSNRDN